MAIIRGWKLLFLKFFFKHHCSPGVEVAGLAAEVVWSVSSCTGALLCPGQEWAHRKLFARACMPSHVPKLLWLSFSRVGICWADSSQSYWGSARCSLIHWGRTELASCGGSGGGGCSEGGDIWARPYHTEGAGTLRPLCSSLVPPPPGSAFPNSSWQGWASAVSNWSRCWARWGLHCTRHCLLSLSRTATQQDASVQALTPVTWRAKSSGDQWLIRGPATASVTLLSAWGQLAQVLQPCVYWWGHLDKITWSNS